MDRSDINDAILLFQYSSTALAGGRAATVVRFLRQLQQAGEIGFVDLGRPSLHGTWLQGRGGFDLRLNSRYLDSLPPANRLGALSLLLVHEGTHAAVNFTRLLDELAARVLPIHYYRELSGPGVFNEANDPPQPGKPYGVIHVAPAQFPSFRRQSDALRREQLIDDILSIRTYTRSSYIDPQWIIDHLSLWGGIANRLPATKGLYVRILAGSFDRHFVTPILDILESVSNREEWNAVMAAAGPLRTLQIALEDMTTAPALSRRLAALQRRWGMALTESPPVR
jgi:hypothetical protein